MNAGPSAGPFAGPSARPSPSEADRGAPEINALIGRGTSFEGKLNFRGRVRIDGTFRGSVQSEDTLIVGEGAEIFGNVDVGALIVRGGVVNGDVKAKVVELYAPGRVNGDIETPQLFIDKGVTFDGKCKMADMIVKSTSDERDLSLASVLAPPKSQPPAEPKTGPVGDE